MNVRIKDLRKELDMTQEEFSTKLGLSRNFIAQIESGTKTPSDRTITDICRIFSVNEEWLRSGKGAKEPDLTREQEIQRFVNSVMADLDDSTKKRFMYAFTKFNSKDWEDFDRITTKLSANND